MNSIKAKSQTEKRLDGFSGGGGGGSYTAGEGIAIGNGIIELKPATSDELGGVKVSGEYHKTGIWKDNGVLEIKSALPGRLGGIKIGDGLIPVLDGENIPSDVVKIRVGDGLSFMENDEETEDPIEIAENTYGGRRLTMRSATKEKIGGVKPGDGLNVDEETGEMYIRAGSGIQIEGLASSTGEEWSELSIKPADPLFIGGVRVSNTTSGLLLQEDGELSVNIGEGLEITDGNKLTVVGVGEGDNYLLLTEETLSDFIHEYKEVGYHSGSKIILATQKPNIVIQGYTAGNTNQKALAPVYTSVEISGLASISATALTDYNIEVEIYSKTDTTTTFRILVNGAINGPYQTYNNEVMGFILCWSTIYGESYATKAPNGCAYIEVYAVYQPLATGAITYTLVSTPSRKYYPFVSLDEYHSAICLTKEENVLTSITETVTEV